MTDTEGKGQTGKGKGYNFDRRNMTAVEFKRAQEEHFEEVCTPHWHFIACNVVLRHICSQPDFRRAWYDEHKTAKDDKARRFVVRAA